MKKTATSSVMTKSMKNMTDAIGIQLLLLLVVVVVLVTTEAFVVIDLPTTTYLGCN